MLVHTRTADEVVNMRETAPAAATQDMFVDNASASTTVSHDKQTDKQTDIQAYLPSIGSVSTLGVYIRGVARIFFIGSRASGRRRFLASVNDIFEFLVL